MHDGENGFDLVVFGAGPGGMGAAYYPAKLGLRVLMIEKDRLPRDRV
ncbi:MAG: FAD-binding protein [Actinomycetota bacterium]|nr:FAD-binding protein [Actinomycetota bacterium]